MLTRLLRSIISISHQFVASRILLFGRKIYSILYLCNILFPCVLVFISQKCWIFEKTQFRERLLWMLTPAFVETRK